MADFCNQCARDLGFPEGDLENDNLPAPPEGKGYVALCEGCGPTLIDERGNCLCPNCDEQHGEA